MITTLILSLLLALPPPVSIATRDLYSFEPASIRLTIRIEPDSANRQWCVMWTGGEDGASCREMPGERAATYYQMLLKNLSAGDYEVVARVTRRDGTTREAGTTFRVLSRRAG